MRSLQVWAGFAGGNTNTVSERFSSRAIACIIPGPSVPASGKTASWLPPNIRSVKTSAVKNRMDPLSDG
jgi:hypothetical protein